MHRKNRLQISLALLLLPVGAGLLPRLSAGADVSQAAKKPLVDGAPPGPASPRIGEVTVSGDPTISAIQNVKLKTLDFDLYSPRVTITSARYDIAAPHIFLTLKGGLVNTGTATGGAEVHIRNPEEKRHSDLTCSTANYFGATPSKPAHLHLVGPVHGLIYDPQLAEPLDASGESCDVELNPDGSNKITVNRGHATVTPIEPPAKSK